MWYLCEVPVLFLFFFSFTYDDVGLAGASACICREVALDLVSSLIEQVEVVFHRVAVVEALAQPDDT